MIWSKRMSLFELYDLRLNTYYAPVEQELLLPLGPFGIHPQPSGTVYLQKFATALLLTILSANLKLIFLN